MTSSDESWVNWRPEEKLALFAALRSARWLCDLEGCDGEPHDGHPFKHARWKQHEPDGEWRVWYLKGGRGSGKSRTGAETLAGWILGNEPGEWAVIGPTFGDARSVCLESDGGLLKALGPAVSNYNRSIGEVYVANGAKVYSDGANDGGERIQGKNLRGAWCDEVGLWQNWAKAWDESLQFAVRLAPGRIIATGTPKAGHGLVKRLTNSPGVIVSTMRTLDNASNLHPSALEELLRQYAGKRLGRQELEAEFLEDVEGALWTRTQLDALRVDAAPPLLKRIVVAVDPNISNEQASNEAGIVVAAVDAGARGVEVGYVLADLTTTGGGPRAWAKAAVDAYHEWGADRIVAEKNQGGEMVRITIQTVDPNVPIKLVQATKGKRVRAEPVAALYEGDETNPPRIHHVGVFQELEDQMTTWTPAEDSPDRMDALVWAFTELMLSGRTLGPMTILEPVGTIGDQNYGGFAGGGIDPFFDITRRT